MWEFFEKITHFFKKYIKKPKIFLSEPLDFYDVLYRYQLLGTKIQFENVNDEECKEFTEIKGKNMNDLQEQISAILWKRQKTLLGENSKYEILHVQSANVDMSFTKEMLKKYDKSILIMFSISDNLPNNIEKDETILLKNNLLLQKKQWAIIPGMVSFSEIQEVEKMFKNIIIPIDIFLQAKNQELKDKLHNNLGTKNFYVTICKKQS